MKGRIDNKMGSIQIDPEVIAMYAGTTAVECFGIVGMAAVSMKDGLVRLLKRESLTHGINVAIKDNALSIDFHVIVAYGVSISTVADNLIESVKYKVEEFTGMKVEKISIYVEGVRDAGQNELVGLVCCIGCLDGLGSVGGMIALAVDKGSICLLPRSQLLSRSMA